MANMMVGALRPHVPEYADVVLAELGKPENKEAFKKYIKSVLADGAKNTFGNVDMKWYSYILKEHGCGDALRANSRSAADSRGGCEDSDRLPGGACVERVGVRFYS